MKDICKASALVLRLVNIASHWLCSAVQCVLQCTAERESTQVVLPGSLTVSVPAVHGEHGVAGGRLAGPATHRASDTGKLGLSLAMSQIYI